MPDRSGAERQVLHISGDFPDTIDLAKTPVIRTLLELTKSRFDHSVISINRRSPGLTRFCWQALQNLGKPQLQIETSSFEYGSALVYNAPPKGILHAAMLQQLGEHIAGHINTLPRQPGLIVGHKLTIEGIAVRHAAALTGLPYALSIQGNTDAKIVAARPDLRRELAAVFHEAAIVFPFAPWALQQIEAHLGRRSRPVTMLPCPTDIDTPTAPQPEGDGFISVFHLKHYAIKNLSGMARAMKILNSSHPAISLCVIGGGSADDTAKCAKITEEAKGISFAGPMDRQSLRARMNRATAFVMASRRESFGLVFIEALFCGLPIIYPAGAAVDGYFDGAPFAVKVDSKDPSAIAEAMLKIQTNEIEIKASLREWQQSASAKAFGRVAIAEAFADGLDAVLDF